MNRFCAVGLMIGLALLAAGCGGASHPPAQHLGGPPLPVSSHAVVHYGPFVPSGGWAGGGGSGLWGDGGSGPTGTTLGCIDGRHYSQAFGIENRSKRPVTLTTAHGANPNPAVIDLVAIQLRLSPRARPSGTTDNWGGGIGIPLAYRGWSAAPTRAVTIPPGRAAAVQTNYLMHDCDELSGGRTVIVPGTLVLGYRVAGRARRTTVPEAIDRIVLRAGPTRRQCVPVAGSASLVAADTACAAARQAALACHPMSHPSFGVCTVAGVTWDCGRIAGPGSPLLESCWQPQLKSHWFSTVWIDNDLTLWGAFASARGRSLAGGGESCDARKRSLVYRSQPLQLGPSFGVARLDFSLPGYHGAGDYGAHVHAARGHAGIRVVISGSAAKGAPSGTYLPLAGRIEVSRAKPAAGGVVYASLRLRGRTQQISLNGRWSCRR